MTFSSFKTHIWILVLLFATGLACKPEEISERGQVTFWINQDTGCGVITVVIEGTTLGEITTFLPTGEPDCGEAGNVSVEMDAGVYSYFASDNCQSWEGTVTASIGGCTRELLAL